MLFLSSQGHWEHHLCGLRLAKLLNFLHWNKHLSNLNYLFLALPQYSIRLVTSAFQSFISLIRLEKGFIIFKKKSQNYRKISQVILIHRTNFLSKNFTSSNTLTTPNSQKITSLGQPRETKFSKNFTSYRQGHLKKGYAGIVTGGRSPPPLKYRHCDHY